MKRKLLRVSMLFVTSSLIVSCGGGGGSDLGNLADLGGGTSSNNYSIRINSLSVEETVKDGVITQGEEFYIKWNVSYSGTSIYSIAFLALPNENVPTVTDSQIEPFAQTNCGTSILDCSKGIKCTYTKETDTNGDTKYYLSCSTYSSIPNFEGWGTPTKKEFNPSTTNFLGADAFIYEYKINDNGSVKVLEHHDKKAIPINFEL